MVGSLSKMRPLAFSQKWRIKSIINPSQKLVECLSLEFEPMHHGSFYADKHQLQLFRFLNLVNFKEFFYSSNHSLGSMPSDRGNFTFLIRLGLTMFLVRSDSISVTETISPPSPSHAVHFPFIKFLTICGFH